MAVAVTLEHMETEVVGRDAELEAIELWLAAPRPSAFLIEGEAGIGKTTLWRAGVTRAKEHGLLVLSCAPSVAESDVAFARCVNGTCCPAIRTTFASGTNHKGVACCPSGTIAVPDNKQDPSNVGTCCRKGDLRCCTNFWSKDDDLIPLKPDPKKEIKRGQLCVNGRIRKA